MGFHRIPFIWEPAFNADPDALGRVAAYQAAASPHAFAPNLARPQRPVPVLPPPASLQPPLVAGALAMAHLHALPSPRSHARASPAFPADSMEDDAGGDQSLGLSDDLSDDEDLTPSFAARDRGGGGGGGGDPGAVWLGGAAVELEVPRGAVGRIIGSGGANIKALEAATGTRVQVRQREPRSEAIDDGTEAATVTVQGRDAASVAAAVAAVEGKVQVFRRFEAQHLARGQQAGAIKSAPRVRASPYGD